MPAAAVIPAPIAYANIAAVKTLVVRFRVSWLGIARWAVRGAFWHPRAGTAGVNSAHTAGALQPGTERPAETPFTGWRKQTTRHSPAGGPSGDVTVNKTACPKHAPA